jgi:hypothetical protein
MPDNDTTQQGNTGQKKQQGGGLKLMLDGTAEKCQLSVLGRPNVRVTFYGGTMANPFQKQIKDSQGNDLVVNTSPTGIGIINDLNFTEYSGWEKMPMLSAVSSDGKQTSPMPMPILIGAKANPSKLIKIVLPEKEEFESYDHYYPVSLLSYVSPNVPGSRRVILQANCPVHVLDSARNPLVQDVTRWEFDTDQYGAHHHVIRPVQSSSVEVKYNVLGDATMVTRKFQFKM